MNPKTISASSNTCAPGYLGPLAGEATEDSAGPVEDVAAVAAVDELGPGRQVLDVDAHVALLVVEALALLQEPLAVLRLLWYSAALRRRWLVRRLGGRPRSLRPGRLGGRSRGLWSLSLLGPGSIRRPGLVRVVGVVAAILAVVRIRGSGRRCGGPAATELWIFVRAVGAVRLAVAL